MSNFSAAPFKQSKEGMGSSDAGGYKGYSVVSLPSKMRKKGEKVASGLLEDVATYFIVFTHSCVEKMTSLPFPIGTIVEAVEELVIPLAHPVEGFMLRLLGAVDDQILTVSTSIEGSIVCLRTRGLIGMSADLWVQHEASLREKLQSIIDLADKIPLIGLITPFISVVSVPLGNAVSDWLVEHSQSHVKRIQFYNKEIEKGKEELGDVPTEASHGIVEAKDVIKDEIEQAETTLQMDLEEASIGEVEEALQELTVDNVTHDDKENDDKDVSAVLDLIDSGWLMGSVGGAVTPAPKASIAAVHKLSTSAPPKASAPVTKRPGSSTSRRSILRH